MYLIPRVLPKWKAPRAGGDGWPAILADRDSTAFVASRAGGSRVSRAFRARAFPEFRPFSDTSFLGQAPERRDECNESAAARTSEAPFRRFLLFVAPAPCCRATTPAGRVCRAAIRERCPAV